MSNSVKDATKKFRLTFDKIFAKFIKDYIVKSGKNQLAFKKLCFFMNDDLFIKPLHCSNLLLKASVK